MDDADLVLTARTGDDRARAAIYDRYIDRVYDFCFSIVRDPARAGEAAEQTFLIAFERLGRLRDPGRLEPWLFALAHRAALEGAAVPAPRPESTRPDLLPPPAAGEAQATRAELSDFIRSQAGILDPADLALLDLHLRQGLDGEDLADAMGVPASSAHIRLNRLRGQIERSLGALVVARTTRRECAALTQLLTASGGRLTPGLREQITRHVDDCEKCNSRRRMVLPMALLAATPLTPAPAPLRARVLGRGPGSVGEGWVFDADGFPNQGTNRHVKPMTPAAPAAARPPPLPRYRARPEPPTEASSVFLPTAVYTPPPAGQPPEPPTAGREPAAPWWQGNRGLPIAALAGVIVLITAITIILASGHGHAPKVAVVASTPTSTIETGSTNAPDTTTPTTNPSTSTSTGLGTTGTTNLPGGTVAQPGHFVVGATKLDFGTTVMAMPLAVSNDGAGGLSFTATSAAVQLTIAPASGTIDPGTSKTLTVTLDRGSAPPGPFATTVAITSGTGTAIVAIAALVDPGPVIGGELASPANLHQSPALPLCLIPTPPMIAFITASVTGPVAIGSGQVVLHWQAPAGPGMRPMSFNGAAASANLGPFATAGSVDWWITATDTAGATGTSAHHQVMVTCN